jgi:hypothetical protein
VKVSERSARTRERRIVIAGWSERGRDSSLGWVGLEIRRTHGSTAALSCLGHGRAVEKQSCTRTVSLVSYGSPSGPRHEGLFPIGRSSTNWNGPGSPGAA